MSIVTVTTEQVHELIQQLAAQNVAASITPQMVANIFEKIRNLNDQEREKVIATAEAYIAEIENTGMPASKVPVQEGTGLSSDNAQDAMTELSRLSGVLAVNGVSFINGSGKWQNSPTNSMAIIKVNSGDVITITENASRYIAYLTTYNHVEGSTPDFVPGTGRSASNVQNLTMPAGCKYFAFSVLYNGNATIPTSIVINGVERLVDYDIPKVINEKVGSVSLLPTTNSLPNIDSVNETISFGSDCFLFVDGKRYKISASAVSLRVTGSSASKIVFDTNTATLKAKAYNSQLDVNEILIGGVRFDAKGIQANFPFVYTIDGKPFYLKETDYIHIKNVDSVEGVTFLQSGETRVRTYYPACAGLSINTSIANGYKFAVHYKKGSTQVYDSGWVTTFNQKINKDCDSAEILYAATNGTDTITVSAIKNAILNFSVQSFEITKNPNYDLIGDLFSEIADLESEIQEAQTSLNNKSEVGVVKTGVETDFSVVGDKLYCSYNRVKTASKIPITAGQQIDTRLADNLSYKIALRLFNEENTLIFDSGWQSSISKLTSDGTVAFEYWFKRDDNENVDDNDITAIVAGVEDFSYTYERVILEGAAPSYEEYKDAISNMKGSFPKAIRSVAHQGCNTLPSESIGNCRVSSYIGAAKAGFDYGECDIVFTSDEIAVCCHDQSFTDLNTQNTIVIAEHTLADLKTYNYHHEQIATFEEVLRTCKENGIGLYIDHLENANTDARWNHLFGLVKKYAMEDKVAWLSGTPSRIMGFYDRSEMIWTVATLPSDRVSWLNEWKNTYPNGKFKVNLNYAQNSVEDIITLNSLLATGVYIEIWTCDDINTYKSYLPYVKGITSNSISELMIK